MVYLIVVKFEEINLKFKKFEKVQDVIKFEKVFLSSRSTLNHNCYRKTLSIVNITMLNGMQYNTLQEGSWLTHISVIKVTLQFTKVCKSSKIPLKYLQLSRQLFKSYFLTL